MTDTEQFQKRMKDADTTQIFFTDLNGRVMSITVNPENIEAITESGIGFDGSSIAGYATVEKSDRILFPVAKSFRNLRFSGQTVGFFIGNVFNEEGKRALADPRAILEKVLLKAETEFGFRFLAGPEHEFFVLQSDMFGKDVHSDRAAYCLAAPHDRGEAVRNRIVSVLGDCGIRFEKAHHEVTASQHEINLEPADPLAAADRTVLFNFVTQKIADELGCHATFMPKPFDGQNRNAFHIHLSMQDRSGRNLFYDADGEHGLSPNARSFIGGILRYARQTSIVMASTFNSYKAYVVEREAPVIRNWGFSNRSAMVRVPFVSDPDQTRIELRSPDPAGNVYLQFAVFIAMGLEGVRQGIDCGKPVSGSSYRRNFGLRVWDRRFLPRSMFEALVEAERSKFLKETLGKRIYENYMAIKVKEWEGHRIRVTPGEHEQYMVR